MYNVWMYIYNYICNRYIICSRVHSRLHSKYIHICWDIWRVSKIPIEVWIITTGRYVTRITGRYLPGLKYVLYEDVFKLVWWHGLVRSTTYGNPRYTTYYSPTHLSYSSLALYTASRLVSRLRIHIHSVSSQRSVM